MTKQQRIEDLERQLRYAREDAERYKRIAERLNKRIEAIDLAWSRVHPVDKGFMLSAKHEDPDMFDVYNQLLYSFGRPDDDGTVRTRISS